jgi:hypothetical protein
MQGSNPDEPVIKLVLKRDYRIEKIAILQATKFSNFNLISRIKTLLKKILDICNYFYYGFYSYSFTMSGESEREVKEEEREEIKDETHELEDVEQDEEEEKEREEEEQEES